MGDIVIEPSSKIEDKDLHELLKNNCSDDEIKKFEVKNELDTAVMLGELRFRANFYKTLNGLAAVLRRVETKIPLMEDLNLPQVLFSLLDAHKGLVLVTGPTGSGKSVESSTASAVAWVSIGDDAARLKSTRATPSISGASLQHKKTNI